MSRFKGTYRIESTRLPGWDYSSPGYYYVTICTNNHAPYFGEIVNGVVHLSSIGEIAAEEWLNTAQVRSNISLDEWIIMPNHVHGILIILETTVETPRRGGSTRLTIPTRRGGTTHLTAPTRRGGSTHLTIPTRRGGSTRLTIPTRRGVSTHLAVPIPRDV